MNGAIRQWSLTFVVVALAVGLAPAPAEAGCKMNVYVENTGKFKTWIQNYDNKTGTKMRGGTWRALENGGWMSQEGRFHVYPDKRTGDEYTADFACGKKRRFRVRYECVGGSQDGREFTTYAPGSTSWSTQQTVVIRLDQCN